MPDLPPTAAPFAQGHLQSPASQAGLLPSSVAECQFDLSTYERWAGKDKGAWHSK